MPQTIRDVMTQQPTMIDADAPVVEAAQKMRDAGIGDVLVTAGDGNLAGILTDRDIAVRVVAEGRDPRQVPAREVCSGELTVVRPDDTVEDVARIMRQRAIRRVPVCDGDHAIGVVSIGDLAIERQPDSALADISAAPPNT